jgi:pyruvate/2-oxoglutarate dehydrogenase complex dihydrolipoamide dehydrogenase (E3) component
VSPAPRSTSARRWLEERHRRTSDQRRCGILEAEITTIRGTAEIEDGKTCIVSTDGKQVRVTADHLVLATGSLPAASKELPFGDRVVSSTEALSLDEIPRRLAIVGAGYIGLELGIAFAKLGSDCRRGGGSDFSAWMPISRSVTKKIEQQGIHVLTRRSREGSPKMVRNSVSAGGPEPWPFQRASSGRGRPSAHQSSGSNARPRYEWCIRAYR